jgi:hypothetical protein
MGQVVPRHRRIGAQTINAGGGCGKANGGVDGAAMGRKHCDRAAKFTLKLNALTL